MRHTYQAKLATVASIMVAAALGLGGSCLTSPAMAGVPRAGHQERRRPAAATAGNGISLVSTIAGAGHFNFVCVVGSYAYVATGEAFIIYDVADAADPVKVSSTPVAGGFSGVWVQGNTAYLSSYNTDAMSVWNVANPASPQLEGSVTAASHPYDIFAVGTTAYVTDWAGNSLGVYAASPPAPPVLAGSAPAARPDYVWVQGHYAYIADRGEGQTGGGGISIFNVAEPADPVFVGSLDLPTPTYSLAVAGSYVYATGMESGMVYVVNVGNPAAPTLAGSANTDFVNSVGTVANPGPWDIRIQGTDAYVAESKRDAFAIYSLSDPTAPKLVAVAKTGNGISPQYLDVAGSYVYVADWESDALQIFDVAPGVLNAQGGVEGGSGAG